MATNRALKHQAICTLAAGLAAGAAHAQFALVSPDTRGYIEGMAVRAGLRVHGEIKAGNLIPGRSTDFWFDIIRGDDPQSVLVACDDSCDDFSFKVFDEFGFEIGSPVNAAHFVFRGEGHGSRYYVRVVLEACSRDVCNVGVAQVTR